jgi:hypothetical protein
MAWTKRAFQNYRVFLMATIEVLHQDSIMDSWLKMWPGRVLSIHPIDANYTISPTTSDSATGVLTNTPFTNVYTPGTFTVPTTATPTFNTTTRRAEYPVATWTITCKTTQTSSFTFGRFVVILDAAPNQKVHFISAELAPYVTLTPGSSYVGSTQLNTK